VVYQRTESFIECPDYDPPETATPEPDDEPTGVVDGWTAVEPVPVAFDVVPEDAAALAVAPEEEVAVPGIV
jgi:hypothetical protein